MRVYNGSYNMKEVLTTITQRGHVTVPAEVRRVLGVKAKDKVAFRIEGDQVTLTPARFSLETAYGSVKPRQKPEDFVEVARQAKEEHVERTLRKLRKR